MTAISSAQHSAFMKLVREELAKADSCVLADSKKQDALIRKQLNELDLLCADYLYHLRSIKAVISKYEAIKKETRITLRKRMAEAKRKPQKNLQIFNHTTVKAS
jgi:hypothetical protein